jgi:hypothetical protein
MIVPRLSRLYKPELQRRAGELPEWMDLVIDAHNRNVDTLKDYAKGVLDATEQTFDGLKTFASGLVLGDHLRMPKTKGKGVQIGSAFGWRDIIGDVSPREAPGAGVPVLATFRGGTVRTWFYAANDKCDMVFHMPHDYVPGSDLHLHLHWSHNGTGISGQLVVTFAVSYARGHDQAAFAAEVAPVLTVSTPNIATVPQYQHRIDELQLSAAAPSATQLDSDLLEPDGLLLINLNTTTIPTITGGTRAQPTFLTLDLHYQSTNVGTAAKAPNFYE